MRSYWRRRCRSCASTISRRRSGILLELRAAPLRDELELVFVIVGGGHATRAAGAASSARARAQPLQRSPAARPAVPRQPAHEQLAGHGSQFVEPVRQGPAAVRRAQGLERRQRLEQQVAFGRAAERAAAARHAPVTQRAHRARAARAPRRCRRPRDATRAARPTRRPAAAADREDSRRPIARRAARSANCVKVRTRGVFHNVRPGVALCGRPRRRAPRPGAARSARGASRRPRAPRKWREEVFVCSITCEGYLHDYLKRTSACTTRVLSPGARAAYEASNSSMRANTFLSSAASGSSVVRK